MNGKEKSGVISGDTNPFFSEWYSVSVSQEGKRKGFLSYLRLWKGKKDVFMRCQWSPDTQKGGKKQQRSLAWRFEESSRFHRFKFLQIKVSRKNKIPDFSRKSGAQKLQFSFFAVREKPILANFFFRSSRSFSSQVIGRERKKKRRRKPFPFLR